MGKKRGATPFLPLPLTPFLRCRYPGTPPSTMPSPWRTTCPSPAASPRRRRARLQASSYAPRKDHPPSRRPHAEDEDYDFLLLPERGDRILACRRGGGESGRHVAEARSHPPRPLAPS